MKVCIIGLGEIGLNIYKEINKKIDCYGVDINEQLLEKLKKKGLDVGKEIKQSDIYIIGVYTTEQVFDVIKKINYSNDPLIVIESTIEPGSYKRFINWAEKNNIKLNLVLFPHRYNPNDKKHHIFNLNRVIGCIDKETEKRVTDFYKDFMDLKKIHITDIDIAEIVKPLENAYRYIEIAIAEEIKLICIENNIDFDKLRTAMNTKWNINLKKALNSIGGKCLPKDIDLIIKSFRLPNKSIFNTARFIDYLYKQSLK